MYRKYMHSSDRKTNPIPITEGFFSNLFRTREAQLAEEHENVKKRAAFRLTYSKYDPVSMYNKVQSVIKKVLNDSEFKELKKIAKLIPYGSHTKSEIEDFVNFGYGYGTDRWGEDYAFKICQFNFGKEVKSSQEGKIRTSMLTAFIKSINKEIEKIDDTYNCSLYDPDADDQIDENHWSSTVFICLDSDVYMFDDKEWKK